MKLRLISEKRVSIYNELMPPKKIFMLEDPTPQAVINMAQKLPRLSKACLGGWISDNDTWIWNRQDTSHDHVAKMFKINAKRSIAFYIYPVEYDRDGSIIDVNFEVSDFSSNATIEKLMGERLIIGIMSILASRKERPLATDDVVDDIEDDFQELLNSLGGYDY